MRKTIIASTAAVASLILSACVGPPAAQLVGGGRSTVCPVAPVDDSVQLDLAFQTIPGVELYLRELGVVESCLPNAQVTWTRYATGQDIVQAFVAESADVGYLGSPPTTKALSAPIDQDVKILHVNTVLSESEGLVAKDVDRIRDLAGGRIGVGFSSTAHYSLLKTLENEGLVAGRDVEVVNVSPDNQPAAFSSGEIDAVYTWDPTLSELQAMGGTTLITSGEVAEQGAPTFNFAMAKSSFISEHPDVAALLTALHEWGVEQKTADGPGFIEANARQTDNSVEQATHLLERTNLIGRDEQAEHLRRAGQALHDTAVFFETQGQVAAAHDLDHYNARITHGGKDVIQ